MKLYKDFSVTQWRSILQLQETQIPKSVIVHGEWEHKHNLEIWHTLINEPKKTPKWNTIVGRINEKQIGFTNVYGAPMAANMVYQFARAGSDRFIQTGYYGGLNKNLQYGSILIVSGAKKLDGISNSYHKHAELDIVESSTYLVNKAIEYCQQHQIDFIVGHIVTVASLMVETEEDITQWMNDGYVGIDMETATTLSIAASQNKEAISLLNLSDLIVNDDNLYDYTSERDQLEARTDEKIRSLAIYLAQV